MRKVPKLSLFFGGLLVGITLYFIFWGFGYINQGNKVIFTLSALFGIFMAFNIGGNDVANSFGTSVGAGTLTITQALCIAAIFEVSGAVIAGGEVTSTIRSGIINLNGLNASSVEFILIMMSALLAAALWLLFASKKGLPVSTTHSIIGGIVGSGITLGIVLQNPEISAFSLVKWEKIGTIALSWIISPILGGLASYFVYGAIKKYILNYNEIAQIKINKIKAKKKELKKEHKRIFETLDDIQKLSYTEAMTRDSVTMRDPNYDPDDLDSEFYKKMHELNEKKEGLKSHKALELGIPIIAAIGACIMSSMLLFKGLKNLSLRLSTLQDCLIIGMITALVWMGMFIFAKTLRRGDLSKSTFLMFSWLQVFTAAGFAFSHGSNDIANAVGPFAAIIDTLATGSINAKAQIPHIVMIAFAVALVGGLWFVGKEVIATVGTNLTKMHPASGFSAELSAASVVVIASMLGLPVSSTHILIGSVLGIGIVNKQTNWSLMKPIGLAWVVTLPAAAVLSSISFLIFRAIFL